MMPDLVPLKSDSHQYQEVQRAFYKTLNSSTHDIKRVIHVQNMNLWEKFNRCLSRSSDSRAGSDSDVQFDTKICAFYSFVFSPDFKTTFGKLC